MITSSAEQSNEKENQIAQKIDGIFLPKFSRNILFIFRIFEKGSKYNVLIFVTMIPRSLFTGTALLVDLFLVSAIFILINTVDLN